MTKLSLKKFESLLFVLIIISLLLSAFFFNLFTNLKRFNSSGIKLSPNGYPELDLSSMQENDYKSLNDLWYNSKVEMLIISPNKTEFIEALKPLRDWKNEKGVKTIILSNWSAYGDAEDDNATKIRKMIKYYYETENIHWVLLAGDAQDDLIPIRKVYNPDVIRWGGGRKETVGDEYYKPTDFYYADLTSSWDNDGFHNLGDGNWGEAPQDTNHGLDEISWIPEVYVGRFPANNAYELEIMVNKTLKYEKNPNLGNWTNRMLLTGGVSSYSVSGQDSGEYESALTSYIIHNYANSVVNYTHLIREDGNLTRLNLINYFDKGYSTVIMAGHGSPRFYYIDPSTTGYTSSDANTSSNTDMPSLVYLDACSMSSFDIDDGSIGETLIKRMNAGAIGVIGGLRVTWYFEDDRYLEKLNRGNAKLFWKEFFEQKKFQQGRALYDSKVSYINSDYYTKGAGSTNYDFERKNILTYNLLGDPEVDIYTDTPRQALNPFTQDIYEGQLVSILIKDLDNTIIPYARVHFRTYDGKYYTTYADINGVAKFRLPQGSNEFYNVTITGHNLIPSHFGFTTKSDNIKPELIGVNCLPKHPSTSDMIIFNVETFDNRSGIERVYFYISNNNFKNYIYYISSNDFFDNENIFTFNIDRLNPGKYSYFVFVRDYAYNTNIFYGDSFKFTIPKPYIDFIFPISLILIIGIASVSVYTIYRGILEHSRQLENLE